MLKCAFPIAMLVMISCGSPKQDQASSMDSLTDSAETSQNKLPGENTLSPDEQRDGWKLLFDGKSLAGWRPYKNMENDSWEAADGTLHCKPFRDDETNKRSDLVTTGQFDNFEFRFDWKISSQGNSGVMFRVTEEFDEPYETGPEYQILDDLGTPGDLEKVQLTGANYHMHYPSAEAKINPVGEWNESALVVNKNHVEHWLNGVKVVEYDILSDDWKAKFKAANGKIFQGMAWRQRGILIYRIIKTKYGSET